MKIPAIALLTLSLLTAALPAANPSLNKADALHRDQVAAFIARTTYAKTHADPVIYGGKGGTLSCIVYTVKQGVGNSPGYTLIIATDTSYAPMDDIALLCDTVTIDPAHAIQCSGHITYVQSGWIATCADGTVAQLGLGKKDRAFKITGKSKTEPV